METNKTLVCPNCGASITNYRNCEYCGSLLVRFVDNGIDLQKTVYFDNSKVFNSLFNALKLSLKMRKQGSRIVAVDVYKTPHIPICSVLQSKLCKFKDDTIIPRDSDKGMFVIFSFDFLMEENLKKFRELDCYPLFDERCCNVFNGGGNRKVTEYFIDFGCDAEGAARLLSEIIEKVYGVTSDSGFECEVNVGNDNIQKSRNYHALRRPMFKKNKVNKYLTIISCILYPMFIVTGVIYICLDDFFGGIFLCFFGLIAIPFIYRNFKYLRGVDDNKE